MAIENRVRKMLLIVDTELAGLRAQAATVAGKIRQCETLRTTLLANLGESHGGGATMKRRRVAAGSVEGRVLEILTEAAGDPVSLAALVEKANAGGYPTRKAVKSLIQAERVVIVGGRTNRAYRLPTKAPKNRVPQ